MSPKIVFLYVFAAALFAAAAATAQDAGGKAGGSRLKNPVAPNEASVRAGEATFKKYCAFCHNADAKGEGPLAPKDSHPPDLTDAKWVHGSSDGDLFDVITNGASPTSAMKGFKGKIPDQDIWNVINYLRTLGPKDAKR